MPPKAYRRFLRDLDKLAASLIASADVPNNVYPIKGGGLPANRTDAAQRGIAIAECLKATLGPAEQPK